MGHRSMRRRDDGDMFMRRRRTEVLRLVEYVTMPVIPMESDLKVAA